LFWLTVMMPAADWPTDVMVLDMLKVPALTLLLPPLPPTAPASALPDLPLVAEQSSSPLQLASAFPVRPEVADASASPPFASWSCEMSPPSDELLFVARASAEEFAPPDVAFPEVSSSLSSPEVVLEACDPLFASPARALALELLEALPLPFTLASLEPPLPPVEEASASPELPERAVVSSS